MSPIETFRLDPSPANAVAVALADFQAAHRGADSQYVDALRLAEAILRVDAPAS